MKLVRFDAFELVRDSRLLPVRSSIDSDSDSVGNVTGGSKWGFESIPDSLSTSSPVRITELPSSVEIDTRGGSSMTPSLAIVDVLPVDMTEFRLDDNPCDPWVLVLNRDGKGGLSDIMLSRLPTVDARSIMLCLAVRSTFFSAKGKYSVRCVVINSLGGRCPKKLRNFEGFLAAACVGEIGVSRAFSGSRTPSPLRMLIVLARLIDLFVL